MSILDKRMEQIRRDRAKAAVKPGSELPKPVSEGLIRGPGLEILIPKSPGATMEEALARANAEKRVMASNKRMDQALVGSDKVYVEAGLPCWTGTMTAYEEPGKPFGRFVEFVDDKTGIRYVFPVPDKFLGLKNGLLVAEHPDFTLETEGNNRIVRAAKLELIEKFPVENKCYLVDPKHGIPFGDRVEPSNADARPLWRIAKMVGLVARGYWVDDYGRDVGLVDAPSSVFGVAVESPVEVK